MTRVTARRGPSGPARSAESGKQEAGGTAQAAGA